MGNEKITSIAPDRDRRDAERHRRLQAAALIELYRRQMGQPPSSIEALELWVSSNDAGVPSPIDPYAILSAEEIARIEGLD